MGSSDRLVLMVEDDEDVHLLIREVFNHRLKLLSALTAEQGILHFRAHHDRLTLIILDASLTRYVRAIETLPVLNEIKASNFRGPVISSSNDHELRAQMCALGCTAGVEKSHLLSVLGQYL